MNIESERWVWTMATVALMALLGFQTWTLIETRRTAVDALVVIEAAIAKKANTKVVLHTGEEVRSCVTRAVK